MTYNVFSGTLNPTQSQLIVCYHCTMKSQLTVFELADMLASVLYVC